MQTHRPNAMLQLIPSIGSVSVRNAHTDKQCAYSKTEIDEMKTKNLIGSHVMIVVALIVGPRFFHRKTSNRTLSQVATFCNAHEIVVIFSTNCAFNFRTQTTFKFSSVYVFSLVSPRNVAST